MLEENLPKDPKLLYDLWLQQAIDEDCIEPYAMTLSTIGSDSSPTSRVVYLRGYEGDSFIFFTNYESDKGGEIMSNPKVGLNFYWAELHRQVRIKGIASKSSTKISDDYFSSVIF